MEENKFEVLIISPPEYEFVVAEILYGLSTVAYLSQENEMTEIEIFPHPSGQTWNFDFKEFRESLDTAYYKLIGEPISKGFSPKGGKLE